MTRGRRVPGWLLAAACTLGGLALFAWVVRRTGPADIIQGIERVGWGLAAILALAGARLAVRAAAWRVCMAPGTTLTYGGSFSAFLAGDTAGTITPFGMLASEPTKVFLTRHHLATRDSIASLAVENLLYSMSVLAMIAVGLAVMLATVPLSPAWRWSIAGALASMAIAVPIAWRLMRGTWDERRGARSPWRERMAAARLAVVGFAAEQPGRLWRAFGFDVVFHLLSVVEVFFTLRWLLGDLPAPGLGEVGLRPTLAQAIVFESLNRVIIVAFKFVPFRIGVDEALTGALAPILSLNPAAGVSLAVVRKVRGLFWAGVGLIVIGLHPTRAK